MPRTKVKRVLYSDLEAAINSAKNPEELAAQLETVVIPQLYKRKMDLWEERNEDEKNPKYSEKFRAHCISYSQGLTYEVTQEISLLENVLKKMKGE